MKKSAARLCEADLAAARGIEPSYDTVRGAARLSATLVAVGAAGTGAASASAASVVTKSGVAHGVAMKLLGVVVLSSAMLTVDAPEPSPLPLAGAPVATATMASADDAGTERPSVSPVKPSAPVVASSAVSLPARSAAKPTKRTADGFARELTEVARARALLSADPGAALAAADKASSSQALAEEREIIAIRALVALGRTEEARARAKALVTRRPDSPFAPIARRLAAD